MSTINKLHIRGIRSFEPSDGKSQMIQFYSPVTLIVGQNGCGKTSIIEALKYVITGTCPPGTDRGASFVNDPKLSSGYEVLAQVKLELTDTKGDPVQITRRMKATQKGRKGQVSVQSLEGSIRAKGKDGNIKDWNAKCVDLNVEMSRYMGVSEAIINNVIFCHQEDSCWPLDEGKKVKERFDAIFNTTGYIASLKKLDEKDKDLANKVREEEIALAYTRKDVEIFRTKKKEIEELTIKMASAADTETKLEKERSDIVDKLKIIEGIEQKLAEFTSMVSVCKEKVRSGEVQEQELKERIKEEFQGDIPQLKNAISNFKQNFGRKQNEMNALQRQCAQKERELETLRKQEAAHLVEEGKFQQEENSNEQRMRSVKNLAETVLTSIKKLKQVSQDSASYTAGAMDSFIESCDDLESITPESVIKVMGIAVRCKEGELEKAKSALDQRAKELQSAIDELKSKKTSVETEIRMKQDQISQNQKAMAALKKRLDAVASANDTLPMLDDEEATLTEKINQIEKSGIITKYKDDIESIAKEIKTMEKSKEILSKKQEMLLEDKQKTDKINFFNRQKMQKTNECREISRKMEDKLQSLFGDVPNKNLGEELNKKRTDLKKEIDAKQVELQKKEREKSHNEAELRQVKRELEMREKELNDWKFQVSEVLNDGDFYEELEKLETSLELARNASSTGDAAEIIYKKFSKSLTRKPCCPLCKRNFADRSEADALQEEIKIKLDNVEKSKPTQAQEMESIKAKLESLAALKPNWEEKSKLQKEIIPELQKKKSKLEENIAANKETLEEINDTLGLLKNEHSIATELLPDTRVLEKYQAELAKFEEIIQKHEAERTAEAKACTVSLQEVQVELDDLNLQITNKRREKETKETQRTRQQDELANFQSERNKVQADKLKITTELQNREALETQKRELEESNKSLSAAIVALNCKIPSMKTEIVEAENAKRKSVSEMDVQLQKVRDEKTVFEKQLATINDIKKQNEVFLSRKAQFAEKQKKIAECKNKIELNNTDISKLRKKIEDIKEEINAQELKERELEDNLKLKLKREELERLRQELATKEQHLADAKKSGGFGNQKREFSLKYERVQAKLNESKGRNAEVKRTFVALRKEVEETYANAEADFQDRFVKKSVYEKAQMDVRRFKKALDHAIMTFHSKRMESINRALKKYWRQIYKGNDIELIQIKTEDADAKANDKTIDLKPSRKSYSYRVVMTRLGVDLDMRGRCSAGQKVLASIIIRIALAEAFSVKCGIISLDEPTTNLDEANIVSLADCLASLAEKMAQTKTFQLIVITHDQQFMDRLLEVDYIENYYKIERDSRGFSAISRKSK